MKPMLALSAALFGVAASFALPVRAADVCAPDEKLVNPCRPWLGATVGGYPGVGPHPYDLKTQVLDHENRIGRALDIVHSYAAPDKPPLSATDRYFIERGTIVYATWKPTTSWIQGDGRNAAVNAKIDQMADAIASVAPRKVMLSVFHEPENDVSGGAGGCPASTYVGSAGTPAEYRAMWRNVRARFNAKHVSNAVWVMNYMGFSNYNCMLDDLWPGNDLVDWVMWDPYSEKTTWNATVPAFYDTLTALSSPANDYASKHWGLAEWGTWRNTTRENTYRFYQGARASLSENALPAIKAYIAFDYDTSRIAYDAQNVRDPQEQSEYNQFANHAALFDPANPVAWDPQRPSVVITAPADGAVVGGSVTLKSVASDNRALNRVTYRIDGKWLATITQAPFDYVWNTGAMPAGSHRISAHAYDDAGNTSESARTVQVR